MDKVDGVEKPKFPPITDEKNPFHRQWKKGKDNTYTSIHLEPGFSKKVWQDRKEHTPTPQPEAAVLDALRQARATNDPEYIKEVNESISKSIEENPYRKYTKIDIDVPPVPEKVQEEVALMEETVSPEPGHDKPTKPTSGFIGWLTTTLKLNK